MLEATHQLISSIAGDILTEECIQTMHESKGMVGLPASQLELGRLFIAPVGKYPMIALL